MFLENSVLHWDNVAVGVLSASQGYILDLSSLAVSSIVNSSYPASCHANKIILM